MGYRIAYPSGKSMKAGNRSYFRLPWMVGASFLCFLLLVKLFWPGEHHILWELLIPGDPAVTTSAFGELADDLRSGVEIGDSLRSFCLQILEGAGFAVD